MIGKGAPLIALSSIGLSYAFEELEGLRQPTKLVYPPNVEPTIPHQGLPNAYFHGASDWCSGQYKSSQDELFACALANCNHYYPGMNCRNPTVIAAVNGGWTHFVRVTINTSTNTAILQFRQNTTDCSVLGVGWTWDSTTGSCAGPATCPPDYTLGQQSQVCIGNPQFVPIDTPTIEQEIDTALQQHPEAAPEVAEEAAEEGHPPEPAGDTGTTPLLDSGPDGVPAPIEGDKKTEVTHGIDPATGHPTTTTKETQPTYTFEPVNDV